jgi:hypothetical protein
MRKFLHDFRQIVLSQPNLAFHATKRYALAG